MEENFDLQSVRARIDGFDQEITKLLGERLKLALETKIHKLKAGQKVYDPAREQAVIDQNGARLKELGFPGSAGRKIFTEIVGACRDAQEALKIAYLGPAATYSHMALEQRFGGSSETLPQETIQDVFGAVLSSQADYGIVPVENSNEGSVTHTLDLLAEGRVFVVGEIYQPVHHCLLAKQARLDEIREVHGHPQALAQSRLWLAKHLPRAQQLEATSNGRAAEIAASSSGGAAIAAKIAAELYQLEILAEAIEDHPNNITRFFVIARTAIGPSGNDRTSLVISVKDKPGILHDLLAVFAGHRINLSRIESRPSRLKPWEYKFFTDLDGHIELSPLKDALVDLEPLVRSLTVIGSYPKAALNQ